MVVKQILNSPLQQLYYFFNQAVKCPVVKSCEWLDYKALFYLHYFIGAYSAFYWQIACRKVFAVYKNAVILAYQI